MLLLTGKLTSTGNRLRLLFRTKWFPKRRKECKKKIVIGSKFPANLLAYFLNHIQGLNWKLTTKKFWHRFGRKICLFQYGGGEENGKNDTTKWIMKLLFKRHLTLLPSVNCDDFQICVGRPPSTAFVSLKPHSLCACVCALFLFVHSHFFFVVFFLSRRWFHLFHICFFYIHSLPRSIIVFSCIYAKTCIVSWLRLSHNWQTHRKFYMIDIFIFIWISPSCHRWWARRALCGYVCASSIAKRECEKKKKNMRTNKYIYTDIPFDCVHQTRRKINKPIKMAKADEQTNDTKKNGRV